jgi:hypothetical protein
MNIMVDPGSYKVKQRCLAIDYQRGYRHFCSEIDAVLPSFAGGLHPSIFLHITTLKSGPAIAWINCTTKPRLRRKENRWSKKAEDRPQKWLQSRHFPRNYRRRVENAQTTLLSTTNTDLMDSSFTEDGPAKASSTRVKCAIHLLTEYK